MKLAQTNFTGGIMSPRLFGRNDIARYQNAAQTLNNWLILPRSGTLLRRPGTEYINEVKASANATRLMPFVFSNTDSMILEFGNLYVRFYKDGAQLGAPYEVATPYAAADVEDIQYIQSADVLYLTHPDYAPRKLTRLADTSWTLTEIDWDDTHWPPFKTENITTTTITASCLLYTSDAADE